MGNVVLSLAIGFGVGSALCFFAAAFYDGLDDFWANL